VKKVIGTALVGMSLNKQIQKPLPVGPDRGLTFISWVRFDLLGESRIFAIIDRGKPIFKLSVERLQVLINEVNLPMLIPKRKWTMVACSFRSTRQIELIVDNDSTLTGNIAVGARGSAGQISSFGLLLATPDLVIREIGAKGPRLEMPPPNSLFFYLENNLTEATLRSKAPTIKPFTAIFLNSFKVEILLPLFAQVDLPLKTDSSIRCLKMTHIARMFGAALRVNERSQSEFVEGNGFAILAHLLTSVSSVILSFELYECCFDIWSSMTEHGRAPVRENLLLNIELWISEMHNQRNKYL
jgi:hypothetical protein